MVCSFPTCIYNNNNMIHSSNSSKTLFRFPDMVPKYVSMWEGACHIYDTKQFSNISRASKNSPLMLSAQGQCQIPRVKVSVLQDCPPHPTPDAPCEPQAVLWASDLPATD